MKIRSDFVTNSSSSSFIVNLNLELADGYALALEVEQWSGDDDSFEYVLYEDAGDGDRTELAQVQAYGYEEIECIGKLNVLNVVKIADAPNTDAMISAITKSLSYEEDFAEDALDYTTDPDCIDPEEQDEIYDDLDEDIGESMPAGEIRQFLAEHLTKRGDLKRITMEIELGGWGEGTPCASDVLSYLFGNSAAMDVETIIDDGLEEESDEEEIMENLKELKLFRRFTDASLQELIRLKMEDDVCGILMKLRLDGKKKIHLKFSEIEA